MDRSSSISSRSSRYYSPSLFTAAQWEELQHQALIYKYISSGLPVPTHLILSLTSTSTSTTPPTNNYPHQPTLSYQYNQLYQMGGNGRKIDLEPGRCRRTDGKKWRCSKEAYPESKYCERHMHRGRNRSRKPVEFSSSSSSAAAAMNNASSSSSSSSSSNNYPLFSSANYQNTLFHPSLHSQYSSSAPFAFSSSNNTLSYTNFMNSSSSSYSHQTPKDCRYMEGVKDDRSTYFNFQNLCTTKLKEHEQEQHCFVMGTDDEIKSTQESNVQSNQQPFHHFFSQSNTTSVDSVWAEVDPSKSPLSTQDLFQSKPRPYW